MVQRKILSAGSVSEEIMPACIGGTCSIPEWALGVVRDVDSPHHLKACFGMLQMPPVQDSMILAMH